MFPTTNSIYRGFSIASHVWWHQSVFQGFSMANSWRFSARSLASDVSSKIKHQVHTRSLQCPHQAKSQEDNIPAPDQGLSGFVFYVPWIEHLLKTSLDTFGICWRWYSYIPKIWVMWTIRTFTDACRLSTYQAAPLILGHESCNVMAFFKITANLRPAKLKRHDLYLDVVRLCCMVCFRTPCVFQVPSFPPQPIFFSITGFAHLDVQVCPNKSWIFKHNQVSIYDIWWEIKDILFTNIWSMAISWPTIYKAYLFRPIFWESSHKIWPNYMVYTAVPPSNRIIFRSPIEIRWCA